MIGVFHKNRKIHLSRSSLCFDPSPESPASLSMKPCDLPTKACLYSFPCCILYGAPLKKLKIR